VDNILSKTVDNIAGICIDGRAIAAGPSGLAFALFDGTATFTCASRIAASSSRLGTARSETDAMFTRRMVLQRPAPGGHV